LAARYVVGIDLGTTNTVVAFVDLASRRRVEVFPIEQRVAAGAEDRRDLLPSALFAEESDWVVGEYARVRGGEVPARFVTSAKSWLAHPSVDRTAPILPWGVGEEGDPKISPVDASAAVLSHVRAAWDRAHPDALLHEQDVVLTVPASFDEAARALTIEATKRAGLKVKLLEEPQAAFLDWARIVGVSVIGDRDVLVVDVGGGTSDFSLMRVRGESVDRIAVGDHLLLGGDNIDLALAHLLEPRLNDGQRLSPARFAQLVAAARRAKEEMLSNQVREATVTLLGVGSKLVGGAKKTTLNREEIDRVLDGFFPIVARDERPARARAGLVAFGLPYASDPAITRHLAQFASRHGVASGEIALLLNGGAFHAKAIVERVSRAIQTLTGVAPRILEQGDPDLSVARGAAAYGLSLRGEGLRIGGGSARSYWIGLDNDERGNRRAVCLVPRGAEPGERQVIDRKFALTVGRTARFDLFASSGSAARHEHVGEVATIDDETFVLLPPIVTAVSGTTGEIPVRLEGQLSEVGTLDLECVESAPQYPRRFRLGFEIRKETDVAPTSMRGRSARSPEDARLGEARDKIERAFAKESEPRDAKNLVRELERILGERASWPTTIVRPLFDVLRQGIAGRKRSLDHERVFFHLAGFLLRPGFGDPLDPQRVAAIVPLWEQKLTFPNEINSWRAFWIAWRRIAGGLGEPMQIKARDTLDPFMDESNKSRKRPKGIRAEPLEEVLFFASALERVPVQRRVELGTWLLEKTWTSADPHLYAALGRLGARVPAYASVHHVIPPKTGEQWLSDVLNVDWKQIQTAPFAAVQLARMTGDRARDVSDATRATVVKRLEAIGARAHWIAMVREVTALDEADRTEVFGEALPPGLRLVE
jgi:hypothetical protein